MKHPSAVVFLLILIPLPLRPQISEKVTPQSYLRHGDAWYEKGQWDRAIAECDRAIALDSARAESYNNRGNIRQVRGDLNGAIADYTEAIAIDRNFGLAYINRAALRRLKGDLGAALEDLNQAVSRSKASRSKATLANAFRLDARNLDLAVAHHERGLSFWRRTISQRRGQISIGLSRSIAAFRKRTTIAPSSGAPWET